MGNINLLRRLDFAWRLFGTGLSFSLFGIGGLFLSLCVLAPLNIVVRSPQRRRQVAQRLIARGFSLFLWFLQSIGVMRMEIAGRDILATERGTLVVANHPTLIDVILLVAHTRAALCVIKGDILRNPFMRGVVGAAGYIPNDADPEALIRDCARALKDGNNVIMFPEGSRTKIGLPRTLQRGVANIALRTAAPIRIVTITCEPRTLYKGQKWFDIPPRRWLIRAEVRGRIETATQFGELTPTLGSRRLTEHLSNIFTELLGDG
ncbi:lysophospholipid acyltransferase family protein [Emcibacter sp. SYSU 3D8]|uniref:lysophospholipid acyltransferase family protein n=1 Tax=Emcibacter sp. SYSU 3D8 TaxID=3133969 RepID=UPI0031FE9298